MAESSPGDNVTYPDLPRRRMTHRRYVIFSLAASVSFLLYLHRYTWNLIRPELQKEYGLSNTTLESLGSAFFFPYALGQVPSGILCDLFGPHFFLVFIILAWSILLPLHGWGGSFTMLCSVRAGFGLAQAGAYPALSQVTRLWFPQRNRTWVQGWIATGFGRGGGAMASIIMGTLLMGYVGLTWLQSLVVLSILGIAVALIFAVTFRNSPQHDSKANAEEIAWIQQGSQAAAAATHPLSLKVALANRSFNLLLLQQFLVAGADVVFALILGSYFESLGVTDKRIFGVLVSLPLWGGAIGGIVGGFVNDWAIHWFQNRRLGRSVVACTGLGLGGVLLLMSVQSSTPGAVAVGLMLARFFGDWAQPTVWGACTDMGERYSATVFGFGNMLGNLGAFTVPFIVGPINDLYTTSQIVSGVEIRDTNYVPAFIVAGSMMVAAAFIWVFIDSSKPIVAQEPTRTET